MGTLIRIPEQYATALAILCVAASALWIGTLFSVSWLSGRARMMADAQEIGHLGLQLFRRWTVSSLLVSLAAGGAWLAAAPAERAWPHWLYGVAAAVLWLVALTVAVGQRARRIEAGNVVEAAKGEGMRRFALLVSVCALVALATLRSSLVP
jgi:hypothetical protein